MRASSSLVLSLATIVLALSSFATSSGAQDFYRGKTVTLFAGQPPGGGIDSEMRLVGQFFGKHIPGEPAIVPRNMPGAGGMILGNHLFGVAKPDGLTLGMPGRSGFVLAPLISAADTKYDLRRFTWIGSSASSNFVLFMRRQSNIRTFDDLRNAKRQIIIAGSGSTTANSVMPEVLAKYENLPIKVVRGYPGIIDAILAVERGEADGVFCQRASIRVGHAGLGLGRPGAPGLRHGAQPADPRSLHQQSEGEGAARPSERAAAARARRDRAAGAARRSHPHPAAVLPEDGGEPRVCGGGHQAQL